MHDQEYLQGKVKAALKRAQGDSGAARRLLLRAAADDARLLRALVAPFIGGIVAHAVERHGASAAPAPRRRGQLSAAAFDEVVGHLGRSVGATRSLPRGMSALLGKPTTTKAGRGHSETMRRLALAYARKQFDE